MHCVVTLILAFAKYQRTFTQKGFFMGTGKLCYVKLEIYYTNFVFLDFDENDRNERLEDPVRSGWQLLFVDRENHVLVLGHVPWQKFNTFDGRKFPIFSNQLFRTSGHKYDTSKILTPQYDLNIDAYGKLYLTPLFELSIGSGFARFTATLTHVALFHGRDIFRQSKSAMGNMKLDVHGKLTKVYKQVREWWFLSILFGSMALSLVMAFVMCNCHGGKNQIILPLSFCKFGRGALSIAIGSKE